MTKKKEQMETQVMEKMEFLVEHPFEPAPVMAEESFQADDLEATASEIREVIEGANLDTLPDSALVPDPLSKPAMEELPDEAAPPKAKRTIRKKKEVLPAAADDGLDAQPAKETDTFIHNADAENGGFPGNTKVPMEQDVANGEETPSSALANSSAAPPASRTAEKSKKVQTPVLTLESRGEVETEASREDVIWHEIHNTYRTRRILIGQLGGLSRRTAENHCHCRLQGIPYCDPFKGDDDQCRTQPFRPEVCGAYAPAK